MLQKVLQHLKMHRGVPHDAFFADLVLPRLELWLHQTGYPAAFLHQLPQGGQDRVVCEFGPGESFAEAVPHTLKHSPVNIRAIEPSRVLCIPAKQLEKTTSPHAFVLRENLSVEMSKKIGVLSKTLSVVGEPRLTDRVLAYLHTLAPDEEGLVTVPFSRAEWATYLRVAEKSLIRELRAMQENGLIEVNGHKVRIIEP